MNMNDRIALLKPPTGRGRGGQPAGDWMLLQEVWSNVKFQSGAEVMRANADVSIVKCSIRIRARRDVDAAMRARHLGVTFEIKAVLPDSSDRDFVFLVCESAKQ